MDNNKVEQLFNRWELLLRKKASSYEHVARAGNKEITRPDIDDICNEMRAFKIGMLARPGEGK